MTGRAFLVAAAGVEPARAIIRRLLVLGAALPRPGQRAGGEGVVSPGSSRCPDPAATPRRPRAPPDVLMGRAGGPAGSHPVAANSPGRGWRRCRRWRHRGDEEEVHRAGHAGVQRVARALGVPAVAAERPATPTGGKRGLARAASVYG